jgi:hypothetical protein
MDLNKPGALVLTDWFDASKFNPGSVGVYQVNSSPLYALRYSYWNGKSWCNCADTVRKADLLSNSQQAWYAAYTVRQFRGLKNKPE